jgi:hypothetical protein
MIPNLFRTAITCRWGKFIGDALLNSQDAVSFAPTLSPQANMSLLMGTNNQISAGNQQVFPTINPIDAIGWADASGRIGLCVVAAVREEGLLAAQTTTVAPNGAGTFTGDLTVPDGHTWVLKGLDYFYGGVQTITSVNVQVRNVTNLNQAIWQKITPVVNVDEIYLFPQSLTLVAGQKIRLTQVNSAWTSGTGNLSILYQESDA